MGEGHLNTSTMIRPAWTPATVALTVAGFMVFWPLGLAMLAYVLFGDRFDAFKRDANSTVDGMFRSCRSKSTGFARTGNVAFDEWREKEIERLNEERRKLDELRSEFEEERTAPRQGPGRIRPLHGQAQCRKGHGPFQAQQNRAGHQVRVRLGLSIELEGGRAISRPFLCILAPIARII
jgi:Protein of unknown function (DUF2852)